MFFVKNISIMLIVILLTLGIIFIFNQQISRMSATIIKNRQQATALAHQSESSVKLQKAYAGISANEIAIRHALLPADNILEFTEALDSTALKHNLAPSLSFGSPVLTPTTINGGKQTIATIDLGISVSTNLFIFLEYLKDLEHLPYFINIQGITITSLGTDGWQGDSTIVIHATFATQIDTPLTPN